MRKKRERRWRQTGEQEADSVVSPTTQRARFEAHICLIIVHVCVLQSNKADAIDLKSQGHQTFNLLQLRFVPFWGFIFLLNIYFEDFIYVPSVFWSYWLEEKPMARSPFALALYSTWLDELTTAGSYARILGTAEPWGNYTQWIDTLYIFVFAQLVIICFFSFYFMWMGVCLHAWKSVVLGSGEGHKTSLGAL